MFREEMIFGQRSWLLESDTTQIAVTHTGAHMAPVFFRSGHGARIQPYHISPWQTEECKLAEGASESILRGDFLCLPFGYAEPGLAMRSHGRSAGQPWTLENAVSQSGVHCLRIRMDDALQSARLTRSFLLKDGENVIYDLASVDGLDGTYTIGHHAVLRTPKRSEALLVSTSRLAFGMTYPEPFVEPGSGESQALAVAAEFDALTSVPAISNDGTTVDCSAFPIRPGRSDLLQVSAHPEQEIPAWTTAVNTEEDYLWFALRNPALLPSTILWIEVCGRRSSPWNQRNCSLGIEDVCSYFDRGSVTAKAANVFSNRGIKTVQTFCRETPYLLPYLQGAISVPPEFGRVQAMRCEADGVSFTDIHGSRVTAPVQTNFVFGEGSIFDRLMQHSSSYRMPI
jgi:hypothetical protein